MSLIASIYCDGGWSLNTVFSGFAVLFGQSCYNVPALRLTPYGVRTDLPPPTFMRAPGIVNGYSMIEAIMQHAAAEIGTSPLELRMKNLMKEGDPVMPIPDTLNEANPISSMVDKIKTSGDYNSRLEAAESFNKVYSILRYCLTFFSIRQTVGRNVE